MSQQPESPPVLPEAGAELPSANDESYRRNFKSSAVLGAARVTNMVVGMARAKIFALLLGTKGVGYYGTYDSIVAMVGTIFGLGIGGSGVREVAQAAAKGDNQGLSRWVTIIKRTTLVLSLIGAVATLALARPLSKITFENYDHVYAIGLLALAVIALLGTNARVAVIQGLGRMGDLARQNVVGATLGTVLSTAIIIFFKNHAISLALVAVYGMAFLSAYVFSKKVKVPAASLTWKETTVEASQLIKLGIALVNATVLSVIVFYLCRALISRQLGMSAVGIYVAAFSLSGKFVNIVIEPMWADFFPRASATAHDHKALNRIVNEQIEIALLLAAPGLLATLVFAPVMIRLFYSAAFAPAAGMMRYFTIGCMLSAVCGPVRIVLLATGRSLADFSKEVWSAIFHLLAVVVMLKFYGLVGVAIAYMLHGVMDLGVTFFLARHVTRFNWTYSVLRLGAILLLVQVGMLALSYFISDWLMLACGTLVTAVIWIVCLKEVLGRLGPRHRVYLLVAKVPLLRRLALG